MSAYFQLCKCLNCETIYIDTNPSDQPAFPVPEGVGELPWIIDQDGDSCFGCDKCGTDGFLIDVFN